MRARATLTAVTTRIALQRTDIAFLSATEPGVNVTRKGRYLVRGRCRWHEKHDYGRSSRAV